MRLSHALGLGWENLYLDRIAHGAYTATIAGLDWSGYITNSDAVRARRQCQAFEPVWTAISIIDLGVPPLFSQRNDNVPALFIRPKLPGSNVVCRRPAEIPSPVDFELK